MSLNAKKIPSNNTGGNRPDPLEPGTYPARLVQILTLGVQKQRPYKGEEKPPVLELMLTYEMLDEFMKNEDGEDLEDKPRWLSETFAFHNLSAELAKSTKRYYALDANGEHDGDWSKLIGAPCMVTVTQSEGKGANVGRIYENVASVSAMRPKEASKAPELVNPPKVFDFYDPDMEIFGALPEWLQNKMKDALDFEGSALDLALNGGKVKAKKAVKAPEPDEDEEEEW